MTDYLNNYNFTGSDTQINALKQKMSQYATESEMADFIDLFCKDDNGANFLNTLMEKLGGGESITATADESNVAAEVKIGKFSANKLSDDAQNYLAGLCEKYPDVDFIIGDFKSDEEANAMLKTATKKIGCVMTPDLLEQMATDSEVREKYEELIKGSFESIKRVTENMPDNIDMQYTVFVNYKADGSIEYGVSFGGEETEIMTASSADELVDKIAERFTEMDEYNIHEEYFETQEEIESIEHRQELQDMILQMAYAM